MIQAFGVLKSNLESQALYSVGVLQYLVEFVNVSPYNLMVYLFSQTLVLAFLLVVR